MAFDKTLRSRVNRLVSKYVKSPTVNLEDQIVREVENYALTTVRGPHLTNPMEDDLQEVRIGIVSALRKYDPNKGEFLTWVIYQVRKRLFQANTRDVVRIPKYVREAAMSVRKATDQNLSEKTREKAKAVLAIKPCSIEALLDIPAGEDIVDTVNVEMLLSNLSPIERNVIELLVLRSAHEKEVASRLKLSVGQVALIKERALAKLRDVLQ